MMRMPKILPAAFGGGGGIFVLRCPRVQAILDIVSSGKHGFVVEKWMSESIVLRRVCTTGILVFELELA
jgi:hypothetical protein